jgi:two-component system nitrate/nitrite response regulator NarL
MSQTIRVLLVDDHHVIREGFRALLEAEANIEVVGEADNGKGAVELALSLTPDIVLLDLMLPVKSGLRALDEIISQHPDMCVVVLTAVNDESTVIQCIQAGVSGYLLKTVTPSELVQAIHTACNGGIALSPQISTLLVRSLNHPIIPQVVMQPTYDKLTIREREVLAWIARGHSNRVIAEALQISEHTVRVHVTQILRKLNLTNRVQALLYYLRTHPHEHLLNLLDEHRHTLR